MASCVVVGTLANKIAQIQKAGYVPVGCFVLPENCWTDHFYEPLKVVQEKFLEKYKGNKTAEEYIAWERHEEALYHKYKAYYGYTFFIAKKVEL